MSTSKQIWIAVACINSTVWAASERQPAGFVIAAVWVVFALLLFKAAQAERESGE